MAVNKRFSSEIYSTWAALYTNGSTLKEIAEVYGVSSPTVRYHLRKQNVPIRSNSMSHMHNVDKLTADLTNDAKQVLIGSAIGDGCIKKQTTGSIMYLAHADDQREWLEYKANILAEISSPKGVSTRPNNGNRQDIVEFRTLPHMFIDDIYKASYLEHGKRSIERLIYQIEPLGLAVLWGDDGCFGKNGDHCYGILSTCAYSFDENQLLVDYLDSKFNITATLLKKKVRDRLYPQIRVSKGGMFTLSDVISDLLPTQMKYKIGGYL